MTADKSPEKSLSGGGAGVGAKNLGVQKKKIDKKSQPRKKKIVQKQQEVENPTSPPLIEKVKSKKGGVKSASSSSSSPAMINLNKVFDLKDAKKKYLKECEEIKKVAEKAGLLQKRGHDCAQLYTGFNPPILMWCQQKQCIMKSAASSSSHGVLPPPPSHGPHQTPHTPAFLVLED